MYNLSSNFLKSTLTKGPVGQGQIGYNPCSLKINILRRNKKLRKKQKKLDNLHIESLRFKMMLSYTTIIGYVVLMNTI